MASLSDAWCDRVHHHLKSNETPLDHFWDLENYNKRSARSSGPPVDGREPQISASRGNQVLTKMCGFVLCCSNRNRLLYRQMKQSPSVSLEIPSQATICFVRRGGHFQWFHQLLFCEFRHGNWSSTARLFANTGMSQFTLANFKRAQWFTVLLWTVFALHTAFKQFVLRFQYLKIQTIRVVWTSLRYLITWCHVSTHRFTTAVRKKMKLKRFMGEGWGNKVTLRACALLTSCPSYWYYTI